MSFCPYLRIYNLSTNHAATNFAVGSISNQPTIPGCLYDGERDLSNHILLPQGGHANGCRLLYPRARTHCQKALHEAVVSNANAFTKKLPAHSLHQELAGAPAANPGPSFASRRYCRTSQKFPVGLPTRSTPPRDPAHAFTNKVG